MNVCVRGPLLSVSGYGYHAREVYKWLSNKDNVNMLVFACYERNWVLKGGNVIASLN